MARIKDVGDHYVGPWSRWNPDGTWESEGKNLIRSQLYNIELIAREAETAIRSGNPNSAILEIGCYGGGSLNRWIDILLDLKLHNPLIAVDPYDNPDNYLPDPVEKLLESLQAVLARYPNSHFHKVRSDDFFARLPIDELQEGASFALIDGFHSEEQMKRDFDSVDRLMCRRSLLCLDDISWVPGLDEWVLERFKGRRIEWLPGQNQHGQGSDHHQALIWYE